MYCDSRPPFGITYGYVQISFRTYGLLKNSPRASTKPPTNLIRADHIPRKTNNRKRLEFDTVFGKCKRRHDFVPLKRGCVKGGKLTLSALRLLSRNGSRIQWQYVIISKFSVSNVFALN